MVATLLRQTAIAVALVAAANAGTGTGSGYEYVDPLIGTTNGGLLVREFTSLRQSADGIDKGHVFPGATLPFGKSSHHSINVTSNGA
jgi:hypothetical protein